MALLLLGIIGVIVSVNAGAGKRGGLAAFWWVIRGLSFACIIVGLIQLL